MNISDIFNKHKRAPFLFIGSGFTRHYYDTPDWSGLLGKFSPKPFNYYISQIGNDYPKIASKIAEDLTKKFWEESQLEDERMKYQNKVINNSSYFKILISEYLKQESLKLGIPDQWKEELEILRDAPIDGIITTNWDDLIEQIFPHFTSYIGQEELFFNKSYNIGEIYKIHGCIKQPESLVLTYEDYTEFNSKYPYLSSKLLTIFVEHPVIFLGYSINDKNIQDIIKSLVCCLSQENINKLKSNMIFVEWDPDENAGIKCEYSTFVFADGQGISFPCVKIYTNTFRPIFESLRNFQRQIPANVLRLYKQNFYDIVYSEKPEDKLCVVTEKDLDKRSDIEFVCGYGIINKFHSAVGYIGIKAPDIFRDVLDDRCKYDPSSILTKTIPNLQGYVPMYRYLQEIGINSDESYKRNALGINCVLKKDIDFQKYYKSRELVDELIKGKDLSSIIREYGSDKALTIIPYMEFSGEQLEELRLFLIEKLNTYLIKKNNYSSQYRKAACFYDWKRYGW